MITHRMSTQGPEPMVRFYKVIALSFLLVTIILLGVVVLMTAKKAEIIIVAEEARRPVSLSLGVAKFAQPGGITGTVQAVDFEHSEDYSLNGKKTVIGTATGEVTMHNESSRAYNLVKTTRLITPEGVLFRLTNQTPIPAGGTAIAKVYADVEGPKGDIDAVRFTIPGLSPGEQKQVYAVSSKPMSGGSRQVAVVTPDDLAAAERNYAEKVNAAFLAALAQDPAATGKSYALFLVNQSVTPNNQVGDEAAELTLSGKSKIVVATFDSEALESAVKQELGRSVNNAAEKILAIMEGRQITVGSYDLEAATAQLNITQEAVVTLDADVESLAMSHFLGKRKEEIERYVLGLNHVQEVEVKFSPRWMVSSPNVPDKIKIVVKNVK